MDLDKALDTTVKFDYLKVFKDFENSMAKLLIQTKGPFHVMKQTFD